MRIKGKILSIILAVTIMMLSVNMVNIMAESTSENVNESADKTQEVTEKDIDNMTLEELKIAYLKLQLEYEKLKNYMSVDDNSTSNEVSENKEETKEMNKSDSAEDNENTEEPVLMDEEEFKTDIVNSYNGRDAITGQYTKAEVNIMTSEESVAYYEKYAEAEREFYEKYKNATFKDLNIQYLCTQYITGLQKQYNAKNVWDDTQDFDKFSDEYSSGYYNRAYVIVELSEYYDLPFGDITDMKADTASMDSLNEAETRNAVVDHNTVKQVQELLNGIGFYCGDADGISGKRTVKSIKRFQEMYGYEPIDGMIDDELVEQLQSELDKM